MKESLIESLQKLRDYYDIPEEKLSELIEDRLRKTAVPNPDGKRYILNSAVISTPGMYKYELITIEQCKEWLSLNASVVESAIGYQETADALSAITGFVVEVNRLMVKMLEGDESLVFRLTTRLPIPIKGSVGKQFVLDNSELGLLTKLK